MLKMDITFKEITKNCFTKIGQFDKLNIQNLCILDLEYKFLKNIYKNKFHNTTYITLPPNTSYHKTTLLNPLPQSRVMIKIGLS